MSLLAIGSCGPDMALIHIRAHEGQFVFKIVFYFFFLAYLHITFTLAIVGAIMINDYQVNSIIIVLCAPEEGRRRGRQCLR